VEQIPNQAVRKSGFDTLGKSASGPAGTGFANSMSTHKSGFDTSGKGLLCATEIAKLLRQGDRFVLAGHIGPDGDTIGSCFGLAMALGKLGKKAVVVLESYADKYKIIPGKEYLYRFTAPLEMDIFIALDCADKDRLSGPARAFFDKAKTTICIDHHETNEGFADYNFIEAEASSTAEMVYTVIDALTEIDADIATAIYSGIVSDTGGFRYMSTSKSTMDVAARLMETGIPFTKIYNELMHKHTFAAAKALGLALENCKAIMDGRIVYTYITREMLTSVGAESSDMDSVVEYLMSTRGAEVALFLYERHHNAKATDTTVESTPKDGQGKIKVSMRSSGLHVGRVAASLGGGGHRLAAGCTIVGTMEDVLCQMLEVIEQAVALA